MTTANNPNVISVSGSERRSRIGRIVTLVIPIRSAVIAAAFTPAICIDSGKKYAIKRSAAAPTKSRKSIFIYRNYTPFIKPLAHPSLISSFSLPNLSLPKEKPLFVPGRQETTSSTPLNQQAPHRRVLPALLFHTP